MISLHSLSAIAIVLVSFAFLIQVEKQLSLSHGETINLPWVLAGLSLGVLCGAYCWIVFDAALVGAGSCVASAALVLSVGTDMRHGVLADLNSVVIALGALVSASTLTPHLTYTDMVLGSGTAFSILGLAWMYMRLRGNPAALGGGDLWFAAACGLWGNATVATIALGIGSSITLLVGVLRGAKATTRLPFAPGIGVGFIMAWCLEHVA